MVVLNRYAFADTDTPRGLMLILIQCNLSLADTYLKVLSDTDTDTSLKTNAGTDTIKFLPILQIHEMRALAFTPHARASLHGSL